MLGNQCAKCRVIVPHPLMPLGKRPIRDRGHDRSGMPGGIPIICPRKDMIREMAQGPTREVASRAAHRTVTTVETVVIGHDEGPQMVGDPVQRRAREEAQSLPRGRRQGLHLGGNQIDIGVRESGQHQSIAIFEDSLNPA